MPPIVRSAEAEMFWADAQGPRRVGRTSTEARLFLKLLPADEPEKVIPAGCEHMLGGLGREQQRLRDRVEGLSWWKWTTRTTRRQEGVWKRIGWLKRMEEPRSRLLYLVARRKRILKQAPVKVLEALEGEQRVKLGTAPPRARTPLACTSVKSRVVSTSRWLSTRRHIITPLSHSSSSPTRHPLVTLTSISPKHVQIRSERISKTTKTKISPYKANAPCA
ncbi:uncharacterized protein L3040_000453 [Drepanopeziza brunnea f. sp. 'multigermtubi']|uniref:uncharacterized protein n=1 Tax=Drepanopeziza brunnea f. sp. 'multigermtubi' TaxID=698441 RepID=UPI00239AD497|nr:hypothetical protein L3040_000453 [Drepanopeziza brunnea f. sp. 'multigermtubi']